MQAKTFLEVLSDDNDVRLHLNSLRYGQYKALSQVMDAQCLLSTINKCKRGTPVRKLLRMNIEQVIVQNDVLYIYLHDDGVTDYSNIYVGGSNVSIDGHLDGHLEPTMKQNASKGK